MAQDKKEKLGKVNEKTEKTEKSKDKDESRDEVTELEARANEIAELKARVAELEAELGENLKNEGKKKTELSPAASWAGWILGALVGATSLALIVVLLGGGLSLNQSPSAYTEDHLSPSGEDIAAEQRQQLITERLVREHVDDINGCLEAFASSHASEMVPGWSVVLRLDVQAGEGGRVDRVAASGENLPRELGACFEQRVRRWTFPAPGNYPIVLPFALEGQQRPLNTDGGTATTDGGAATSDGGPSH
jgi:hypothetical protein